MSQCPGRQTASSRAGRHAISSALASAMLLCAVAHAQSSAPATTGAQPQTCYRDDAGRIVTRRRPGYVEVPCPPPGTTLKQPGVGPAAPASGANGATPGAAPSSEPA